MPDSHTSYFGSVRSVANVQRAECAIHEGVRRLRIWQLLFRGIKVRGKQIEGAIGRDVVGKADLVWLEKSVSQGALLMRR